MAFIYLYSDIFFSEYQISNDKYDQILYHLNEAINACMVKLDPDEAVNKKNKINKMLKSIKLIK